MKKIAFVFTLAAILILGACSSEADLNLSEPVQLRINENITDVSLNLVTIPNSETTSVDLVLVNDSDDDLLFGAAFFIDYFDGQAWRRVIGPEDVEFIAIAYFAPARERTPLTYQTSLYLPDGFQVPGRYRIRMDIFRDKDNPITESDFHDLVVEFFIE